MSQWQADRVGIGLNVALHKMRFRMRSAWSVSPAASARSTKCSRCSRSRKTGKVRKRPIVLVGRAFWTKLVNFDWLVETGMITAEDLKLFHLVETAEETWAVWRTALGLGLGLDATETLTGKFADDV